MVREQNTTDHGKNVENRGDAGEHEVEISVWCSFGETMGTEVFTLPSALRCIQGSHHGVKSHEQKLLHLFL